MKKQILCFGDSNTHGYIAGDNGRYDRSVRWPGRLAALLGDMYEVIEEGLSGRTTCFDDPFTEGLNALTYITPCLMSHKPLELLIIMLGTNDTKERFSASSGAIALGLKRLVQKAMTTECWETEPNILIVVPKNIEKEYEATEAVKTMGTGCAEKSQGLANEYRTMARLLGCRCFDANEVVRANDARDYVHLSEEGHLALGEAIAEEVKNILT